MPTRSIVERLSAGEMLLLDGATGSELQARGVDINRGATSEELGVWSATANLDAPDVVRQIHEDYLEIGADIVISNNFYTSQSMLALIGEENRWEQYTQRGGELAVQARNAVNPEAYVAGGISPPYTGDLRKEFEGQARVLARAGVDFLLAEYMAGDTVLDTPIADCVTAVDVCATTGLPVFLGICGVKQDGTLHNGESFKDLAAALEGHAVAGIFLMCSTPPAISACLPKLREAYDGPIGAYAHLDYGLNPKFGTTPDEQYFSIGDGEFTPERYAEVARQWKEMGAQIIGGCCATRPEHIKALRPIVAGKA